MHDGYVNQDQEFFLIRNTFIRDLFLKVFRKYEKCLRFFLLLFCAETTDNIEYNI